MLPAGGFYAVFFVVPMLCLLVLSFWRAKGFELIPDFTLDNYRKIFTSPLYRVLMLRTIGVAFVTTLIVVPVAFTLSYMMRFVFARRGQLILQIVLLSLFSGYLVRIYAWRTILGKQGLLNSTLQWLGLVDQPLEFLLFSPFSAMVTLIHQYFPFMFLALWVGLETIRRSEIEAAMDLGARWLRSFRRVVFPLSLPGVVAGFLFVFIPVTGEYLAINLMGGPSGISITNVIVEQFGQADNWPLGAALSFILLLIVGVILAISAGFLTQRAGQTEG